MNTKFILFLSCFAAVALTASLVSAAPRRMDRGGARFSSMPARGWGPGMVRDDRFRRFDRDDRFRRFDRDDRFRRFDRDDRFRRFDRDDRFIFFDTFGFPFWGWGWGYPYGYYGYPPYGYYGNGYYGDSSYGYGDRSRVAEMQRRLAQAGYYHGSIDGIMGPRTRRAMRAYRRDHGTAYG